MPSQSLTRRLPKIKFKIILEHASKLSYPIGMNTITKTQMDVANNYIKRIRNKAKQQYAAAYLGYKCGLLDHEPEGNLSYMAAQAVRWNIADILGIH